MMQKISDILDGIELLKGKGVRYALKRQEKNPLFKYVIRAAYNPYMSMDVGKIPETPARSAVFSDEKQWQMFFEILEDRQKGETSREEANEDLQFIFTQVTEGSEKWMRRVLKRHLKIGANAHTINAVFPDLVPKFEVQEPGFFDATALESEDMFGIEHKRTGDQRIVAFVENGESEIWDAQGEKMDPDEVLLKDLLGLRNGVYDAYMRDGKILILDWMTMDEWIKRSVDRTSQETRELLEDMDVTGKTDHVVLAERAIIAGNAIKSYAGQLMSEEDVENVYVRRLDAPYVFGDSSGMFEVS